MIQVGEVDMRCPFVVWCAHRIRCGVGVKDADADAGMVKKKSAAVGSSSQSDIQQQAAAGSSRQQQKNSLPGGGGCPFAVMR
jgi:hypothetical protein